MLGKQEKQLKSSWQVWSFVFHYFAWKSNGWLLSISTDFAGSVGKERDGCLKSKVPVIYDRTRERGCACWVNGVMGKWECEC